MLKLEITIKEFKDKSCNIGTVGEFRTDCTQREIEIYDRIDDLLNSIRDEEMLRLSEKEDEVKESTTSAGKVADSDENDSDDLDDLSIFHMMD